jgi:hypothetical protein
MGLRVLLLTLGLGPEQTRYDRDLYVSIAWENVGPGWEDDFRKTPRTRAMPVTAFDMRSVLMYPLTAGSVNGRPTILVKVKNRHEK